MNEFETNDIPIGDMLVFYRYQWGRIITIWARIDYWS
jgi:hypothetical protein